MKTIEEINREFQQQMANENGGSRKKAKKDSAAEQFIEPMSFPSFGMVFEPELKQEKHRKKKPEKEMPVSFQKSETIAAPPAFSLPVAAQTVKPHKKGKTVKLVFSVLLVLVTLVTVILAATGVKIGTKLPITAFCIEGKSMQDVYPEGSLLFVKKTDANNIIVGDNLTYFRGDIYVTHKVIEVLENYDGTGKRSFITQGVNNDYTDPVVSADSVVGVVKGHVPGIGNVPIWFSGHIYILVIAAVVIFAGMVLLIISGRRKKKLKTHSPQPMAFAGG